MNEYLFMVALVVTVFLCAATWYMVKELFNRWVNNDWCHHDWGEWGAVSDGKQLRFCKKCNKAERGHL